MPTVRMTKDITKSAVNRAVSVFNKRFNDMSSAVQFPYSPQGFYSLLVDPYEQQIAALPSSFFIVKNSIEIRSVAGISAVPFRPIDCGAKPFPLAMPKASDVIFTANSPFNRNSMQVTILASERWEPLAKIVLDWKTQHDALVVERDEFVRGVNIIMSAHSTVNAAVKAWPALWELLSDDVKVRMRGDGKTAQTPTREKTPVSVDIDRMTAAVALSKIL